MAYKTGKMVRRTGRAKIRSKRYRRFKRNYMSYSRMAYQAYKGFRMIKGIVNSELKKADVNNPFTPSNTWASAVQNAVGEGSDVGNREGISILAKYLSIVGTVDMNASATNTQVRILILVDKGSPNGTMPTASTIFTDSTKLITPISPDWTQRFVILHDQIYSLSINGDRNCNFKRFIPLNFHIRYTGTASTTWDQNSIYIFTVSSEATNTPTVNIESRLAYYDN